MMKQVTLRLICIALCLLPAIAPASPRTLPQNAPKTVALFSPGSEGNAFWSQIIAFTRAAADDFGWKLEVYYGNDDPKTLLQSMERVAKSSPRPDAFIFASMKDAGENGLKICEAAQMPAFIINMGLDEKVAGAPRARYKYWIGQMVPDDELAGYELANALFKAASALKLKNSQGLIGTLGVSGRSTDAAAILRNRGLEKASATYSGVSLQPVLATDWTRTEANEKVKQALAKNQGATQVVWAASDNMALGIVESAPAWGYQAGQNLLVGGVDWTPAAIKAVQDKKLVATAGGHFMEGGWAIVLLYDYFNGMDFATEAASLKSPMSLITAENAPAYQAKLGDGNWGRINFLLFSKVHNKALSVYNFQISTVLRVLR